MAIKKTFSFKEKYKDVVEHIEKQGNASNYIIRLVQQDMRHSNIEETIEQIIDRKLAERKNDITLSNGLKNFLGK
jgi:acyl carrier protein